MSANSPSEFNLGPPAVDHSSYHSLTGPGRHLGPMHDRTLFGDKGKSKTPGGYKKRKSRKHKGGVKVKVKTKVETRFQKAMANFSRKKATEEGMTIPQINRAWTKVAKNGTWIQYIPPPPSNPQEGGRRKTRRRKTRRRKARRRKTRRRKTKRKKTKRRRRKKTRRQIGCNKY
jgi:hypothetical protein